MEGGLGPDNAGSEVESTFAAELDPSVQTSLFRELYAGSPRSRQIHNSASFVVFADLSPLKSGHLLVVPRRGIPSFAHLSEEEWQEWEEVRSVITERLRVVYGPVIAFEHGSTPGMAGSACISYAHHHLLPAEIDISGSFARDGLEVTRLEARAELRADEWRQAPYFAFESAVGEVFVARAVSTSPRPPSQYLRQEVGRALGIADPEWDWSVVVRKDLLRETVERLSSER